MPGHGDAKSLRALVGRALEEARKRRATGGGKLQTFLAAATDMKLSGAKGMVKKIQDGEADIPLKRLMDFAHYTRLDPAGVLILQSLAKALSAIGDDKEKCSALTAAVERLLKSEGTSLAELAVARPLPSRTGDGRKWRKSLLAQSPFVLWQSFESFLGNAKPDLVPCTGAYRCESLRIPASSHEGAAGFVIRGGRASGAEFIVDACLRADPLVLPIYIDASVATAFPGELADYVDQELSGIEDDENGLSIRGLLRREADLQKSSAFVGVIYNLPTSTDALRSFLTHLGGLWSSFSFRSIILLANELLDLDLIGQWFDVQHLCKLDVMPLGLQRAIETAETAARRIDATVSIQNAGWLARYVRHPFWLGLFCRMYQDLRRAPMERELLSIAAVALYQGRYPIDVQRDAQPGALCERYPELRDLAKHAHESLTGSTAGARFELSLPTGLKEELGGSGYLLQASEYDSVRLAFPVLHLYFACLHWIQGLASGSLTQEALRAELGKHFPRGVDYQATKGSLADILTAEAVVLPTKIASEIQRIVADTPPRAYDWTKHTSRFEQSRRHPRTLSLLIENQAFGRELQRLLEEKPLPPLSDGRALRVDVMLGKYQLVRRSIQALIDAGDRNRATDLPIDMIVCPHYLLFKEVAKHAKDTAIHRLDNTTRDTLIRRDRVYARECCCYDGEWYGVPFQYPTKLLCYRKDLFESDLAVPATMNELMLSLAASKANGSSMGIGLQGRPDHPALYYEWLAFAQASGGGDVLWHPELACGEVVLDTPQTIATTRLFLDLFNPRYAHPNSIDWDWDTIAAAMRNQKRYGLAMCLPFSDAIAEVLADSATGSENRDFGVVPFRLSTPNASTSATRRVYGHAALPLHVFTAHVMVFVKHDASDANVLPDSAKCFAHWFLDNATQYELVKRAHQAPPLDSLPPFPAEVPFRPLLEAACTAQRFMAPPVDSLFTRPDCQLADYQQRVLSLISHLVVNEQSCSEDRLRGLLAEEAETLRTAYFPIPKKE